MRDGKAALAAAFRRQFPNGLGRPVRTTADANGTYFLPTPAGVRGFVRCAPPEAPNLVLSRFVAARQSNEQLLQQDVTPPTTVISMIATEAIQAGLDPVPIQDALLASLAPLTILLPDHPNGNGMFATVALAPGATLSNPDLALLAFTATTIFNTMRQQRASLPATITFTAALTDYAQDATFQPALASLTPAVNTAVDQGQPVIGLGRSDISTSSLTGTLRGTVVDASGAPLANARVVATQNGATLQTATTDATGAFTLADIPAGSITITASLGLTGTSTTLTVLATQTVSLPLTLSSAPQGQLLVSSEQTNAILRYDGQTGAFLDVFAPPADQLSQPQGLVFGPDGHLYLSSTATDAILRYDGQTGVFRDIFVSRGSGGLAAPAGLVFGPDSNLYVTSVGTNAILRYDGRTGAFLDAFVPSDTGGLACPTELVFGPDGHLYVSSNFSFCTGGGGQNGVLRYDGRTGAFLSVFASQGAFTFSQLRATGLAFGPDSNLYVSDANTDTIVRFNGQTGAFLNAFVSGGSGGLSSPQQLVFGSDGNLYVVNLISASTSPPTLPSAQILRYDGRTGAFLNDFVPSGAGGLACSGGGLVFGPGSDLYVISNPVIAFSRPCPGTFGVLRYDGRTGAFLQAFILPQSLGLVRPQGLVLGLDSHLYVASADSSAILRYDGQTGAFLNDFVPSGSGGLERPSGLVFGPDGHLYVTSTPLFSTLFASSSIGEILRYDGRTGAFLDTFVPRGTNGGLNGPEGLVFGPDGHLYVASADTSAILRYDGRTGAFLGAFVPRGRGGLSFPQGLVFGPDGNLYVSSANGEILRYDGRTGAFLGAFVLRDASGGLNFLPSGLVFGPDGNLYVSNSEGDEILRYNGQTGVFLGPFVPRGSGGLAAPAGLIFLTP